MIKEHNIAGNKIFTLDNKDNVLIEKLLQNNYSVHDYYMDIYNSNNFNSFYTPIEMDPKSKGPGYQNDLRNRGLHLEWEEYICTPFNEHINKEGIEGKDLFLFESWYLYQPNEDWIDNPPHQHQTANYVAVTYLELSEGDHIIFYDTENNPESYYPKLGETVFFGGDIMHKPGESSGEKRVSLNGNLTYLERKT